MYQASGIFKRDVGTLPPSVRKTLERIKDEPLTSVELFRYPLEINKLIKFFNLKTPYDEIFHLGILLNGKYVFDKDEVLHLGAKKLPKSAELKPVSKGSSKTIGEFFNNTQKKQGAKFTEYDAKTNNCQNMVIDALSSNGISPPRDWILQDPEKIFTSLGGKWAELVAKVSVGVNQVVNRLQEGEGETFHYKKILI